MSARCTACGWSGAPADADRHLCNPRRTHGIAGTYDSGCRCTACREARIRYQKRWLYDRSRGVRRWIPVTEVRPHVRRLLAAGMTLNGIAKASGVSRQVVHRVARGDTDRLQAAKAAAILAVPGPRYGDDDETFVDRHGTVLRIRALLALGWRHEDMRAESGVVTHLVLAQPGDRVTWRNRQRVAAMYDRLSMRLGPSRVTAARAAKAGYLPPLALDDDRIDDPAYRPDRSVLYRRNQRGTPMDTVIELIELGETDAGIAQRLGISETSARRARERHTARLRQAASA